MKSKPKTTMPETRTTTELLAEDARIGNKLDQAQDWYRRALLAERRYVRNELERRHVARRNVN
jgi:hypothetical protein